MIFYIIILLITATTATASDFDNYLATLKNKKSKLVQIQKELTSTLKTDPNNQGLQTINTDLAIEKESLADKMRHADVDWLIQQKNLHPFITEMRSRDIEARQLGYPLRWRPLWLQKYLPSWVPRGAKRPRVKIGYTQWKTPDLHNDLHNIWFWGSKSPIGRIESALPYRIAKPRKVSVEFFEQNQPGKPNTYIDGQIKKLK